MSAFCFIRVWLPSLRDFEISGLGVAVESDETLDATFLGLFLGDSAGRRMAVSSHTFHFTVILIWAVTVFSLVILLWLRSFPKLFHSRPQHLLLLSLETPGRKVGHRIQLHGQLAQERMSKISMGTDIMAPCISSWSYSTTITSPIGPRNKNNLNVIY